MRTDVESSIHEHGRRETGSIYNSPETRSSP